MQIIQGESIMTNLFFSLNRKAGIPSGFENVVNFKHRDNFFLKNIKFKAGKNAI